MIHISKRKIEIESDCLIVINEMDAKEYEVNQNIILTRIIIQRIQRILHWF